MVYAFGKKTFLNDAIVGAYTAVLNNLTVQNRNALFIPPTSSYRWEDDTPKQNLNSLRVSASNTCGRNFKIAQAFKLGYSMVYFPLCPSGDIHWIGISVERAVLIVGSEGKTRPAEHVFRYDIHDSLESSTKPSLTKARTSKLEAFLKTLFGISTIERISRRNKQKSHV